MLFLRPLSTVVEWNELRYMQLARPYSTLWGKENEMTKIALLFWSFLSFSLVLMQTPITITIESARFFETTLSVFRNALLLLLLLTMDCRGRVIDEAGAEMGIDPLKPHWVLFATLFFFTSTNREMKQEQQKRKLGR